MSAGSHRRTSHNKHAQIDWAHAQVFFLRAREISARFSHYVPAATHSKCKHTNTHTHECCLFWHTRRNNFGPPLAIHTTHTHMGCYYLPRNRCTCNCHAFGFSIAVIVMDFVDAACRAHHNWTDDVCAVWCGCGQTHKLTTMARSRWQQNCSLWNQHRVQQRRQKRRERMHCTRSAIPEVLGIIPYSTHGRTERRAPGLRSRAKRNWPRRAQIFDQAGRTRRARRGS